MNSENAIPASVFILIGGKSERFGSPKWRAEISGEMVLNRLWQACAAFESRYVTGKEQPADLDKPFIQDELEIQAPIIGLYTALKQTQHDWNLLLSCDLPLMTADVFQTLWNRRSEDADIVVPQANNRVQVTCALYHRRLRQTVAEAVADGILGLFRLTETVNSVKVSLGKKDYRFFNMNTVEDLDTAQALAEKMQPGG
ncbi:MAG: molybdenum cofactor guanylyltransferase [Candidatus Marinimicrobia bacterium]|jgi:molybdopterin-guanine dinucleotide biosynthesis protein A|nr:molybdenum cofactor guanylyltransferase [Candidatus Neomarinimicrobiota bacterium]MDP6593303.1 molybdenum cofactor guanylyltransferase [Candidatus Neomarinimicrobiota bacterium]MDP6837284.1 molybdenum cofactor guanylyltransferase [Candidatus Neomarinimicrobiota bacterium]MDP6967022.1 molybdenum cofactor guanylyltransferase [Candidatus Neomarinimicrobiota bacterium]|tara:strand:- start:1229 stop:1825 length:597 start_codon:yes stop_codon:yes gene_type:complete